MVFTDSHTYKAELLSLCCALLPKMKATAPVTQSLMNLAKDVSHLTSCADGSELGEILQPKRLLRKICGKLREK